MAAMVDNKSTHVKTQESQENKVMEGSETLTTPQDNDIVTLTHSIIELGQFDFKMLI